MKKQRIIQGYAQYIENIYKAYGLNDQALRQAINDNVFMATMNFTNTTFVEGESRSDSYTYLNRYDDWFHRLIRQSFGNHPNRKKPFQPASIAFVDYSGSREDKNISLNELRMRGQLEKLHVHAIVALKPDGQEFRRPLLVAGSAHQLRMYANVMVEAFNPEKGSLENMIEYCAKGAMGVDSGRAFGDLWDVFPRFRGKTKKTSGNESSSSIVLSSASGF